MKHLFMQATRTTRVGVLREGKPCFVPDDVAEELLKNEWAVTLEKSEPETATRVADEDAALRTKRARR